MKTLSTLLVLMAVAITPALAGQVVDYQVNNQKYEGYFVSPSPNAPLVLLIHDWDGLTDYEVKRAEMLAELEPLLTDLGYVDGRD